MRMFMCPSVAHRLPKLHTLQLDVQGQDDQAEQLLLTALPHKPSLCSLQLQLYSSWRARPQAWKAIGDATQLTELEIKWEDEVSFGAHSPLRVLAAWFSAFVLPVQLPACINLGYCCRHACEPPNWLQPQHYSTAL